MAPNQPRTAEPAEHGDEAREHEQRDMAGQHVGEQTHAMGDRPRQERQHLDEHDQRQDVDRDALGHEQVEEVQPVLPEAVDDDGEEHQQRQRGGDDDVAHHRELVGNEPDDVRHQDEHEQREHQREELHPALADGVAYGVGDELIGEFGDRLDAARHDAARRGRAQHQRAGDPHGHQHVETGIGEIQVDVAAERQQGYDLELVDRIGHGRNGPSSARRDLPSRVASCCPKPTGTIRSGCTTSRPVERPPPALH